MRILGVLAAADAGGAAMVLVIGALVLLGAFFVFRAVVLWYFKLDKLDVIEAHLAVIARSAATLADSAPGREIEYEEPETRPAPGPASRPCPACGKSIDPRAKRCMHCMEAVS